jgi:hypothetical protein
VLFLVDSRLQQLLKDSIFDALQTKGGGSSNKRTGMFWGGERILTLSSALKDPPPVEDCRRTTMQTAVSNAASSSLDTN